MQKNTPQYINKCAARQNKMRWQREKFGYSYAELGKIWKISAQRAHQIVNAKNIEVINT